MGKKLPTPRNRRKSARHQAHFKARRRRKKAKSVHGRRLP